MYCYVPAFLYSFVMFLISSSSTVSDITTSLTTAFGSIVSDCLAAIAAVVPIAVPILGAFVVIKLGIKTFKYMSGK